MGNIELKEELGNLENYTQHQKKHSNRVSNNKTKSNSNFSSLPNCNKILPYMLPYTPQASFLELCVGKFSKLIKTKNRGIK